MRAVLRLVLRIAAEWTVLILLGGALGIGTAEAMQAGWVSERTVFIGYGVLMAAAAAFVMWAGRDIDFIQWDAWDDDPPAPPDA